MTAIAIVGLGYVGIPLAVEFGKIFPTIGYDQDQQKIAQFKQGISPSDEITAEELKLATQLTFTYDPQDLSKADFIILAVPTLINEVNQPDFAPLRMATEMVGRQMKKGATVIYESTVYPGATEEVCIPILESSSGMKWKTDFHVGYSPERVNPGDKFHTLTKIVKIVSGDSPETLEKVSAIYTKIIQAGIYKAGSMKVAEAAKVVENTQRDLNIALMNEVAIISHMVGINTNEVIDAAATKWNFIPLRPGLVGGHCIGIVPYYLTYKAETMGYHPDVILAGRRINDGMGKFVADQIIKELIALNVNIHSAKVNVLGLAFKPDVQDISNSKIVDVIRDLESFGVEVFVYDPIAKPADAKARYDINLTPWDSLPVADALVIGTPHQIFLDSNLNELLKKLAPNGLFVDINTKFDCKQIQSKGFATWSL
jgi:UDP-N-acetyl-D-glucosamine/UDP-N-acetyl-D-galactosamine dehydrogenase